MSDIRSYSYFEYTAAKLFYEDTKLHLFADQADSGTFIQPGSYDIELQNPMDVLNFHTLWEDLHEKAKEFYRKLAYHTLYGEKEIAQR